MRSARVDVDDVRVNFQLAGPERAPVVLLAHALGSSGVMWELQVPALAARWRVLRYDVRGHGGTTLTPGPYTVDRLADDAIELLDVLGIDAVHWVGHSLGATIGENLALRHAGRVRSLTLCGSACGMSPESTALWGEHIALAARRGIGALCEPTMERWFTARFLESNPPPVRAIRAQFLATPTSGYVACGRALREVDYRNRLPGVTAPTRVVVGAEDPVTPPAAGELVARQIHGAGVTVLEGAAHLANVERAQAFNEAVIAFLDEA